ncbi:sugar ABC transporter permease [Devosia yakushimensis]|uniref:Sugar ABC transporter permease n=1 Tax=Devosia yakushimensis TaxID=470028 RepID=A0ABQ5ULM1_9HYPH|nr:sugar ABC transporter permease [Devosia yakushimensis]GLQ12093.1 sugar ABC transporter permease [Devosia yakushimensis]
MTTLSPNYRKRADRSFMLFLLFPTALFVLAYVYPIAYTFVTSLHEWDGLSPTWKWIGFANYAALLESPRFWNALSNNIRWLIFYLIVPTGVGLGLATLLDEKIKGENIFKVIFFIPFTMTPVAVAAIWKWMYRPGSGVFSSVGAHLGLSNQNWLGDPSIVSFSIMAASLWWTAGFAFLVYFAGLRSIPKEYIEAAQVDGAKPWTIFWQVTFPLLLPTTVIILGVSGVEAMRVFDIVQGMTQGGPFHSSEVLATFVYDTSFARFEMGKGAAIAVTLMALACAVILPYILYISGRIEERD